MTTQLSPGQQVQIIPRRGTILAVESVSVRRRTVEVDGKWTYPKIPVYLVEFEDGSKARMSAWEVEATDE